MEHPVSRLGNSRCPSPNIPRTQVALHPADTLLHSPSSRLTRARPSRGTLYLAITPHIFSLLCHPIFSFELFSLLCLSVETSELLRFSHKQSVSMLEKREDAIVLPYNKSTFVNSRFICFHLIHSNSPRCPTYSFFSSTTTSFTSPINPLRA